jgi:hypothetical protein
MYSRNCRNGKMIRSSGIKALGGDKLLTPSSAMLTKLIRRYWIMGMECKGRLVLKG